MIMYLEAKSLAKSYLTKISSRNGQEYCLYPDSTAQIENFGWVFYFNSRKFFETNDYDYSLLGIGPLIVNKYTGEVVQLSHLNVQNQINEYREKWVCDYPGSGRGK